MFRSITWTVIVTVLSCAWPLAAQDCIPSETVACFLDDRIQVEISWEDAEDNPFTLPSATLSGQAQVVNFPVDETTALFRFDDPERPVVLLKVLDGSGINNKLWLFASATTNQQVTITATDTLTGYVKAYMNPLLTPFSPITDTSAFDAAPTKATTTQASTVQTKLSSCDPENLCLLKDRFEVSVVWRDFAGHTDSGQAVPVTNSTGLFWLFHSENIEFLVSVVDALDFDGHYWFYAAGTTPVEVTLTVRDRLTGRTKSYFNPLGRPFATILDNRAFPALTIEKATNGIHADEAPGAYVEIGNSVEWTYVVTNHDNEPFSEVSVFDDREGAVSCPQDVLEPDRTMKCSLVGTAVEGQYSNLATVTARRDGGEILQVTDRSHYFGFIRDPEARVTFIPAAAGVTGANDTLWKTTLQLYNGGSEDEDVLIALLERGEANTEPAQRMVTIPVFESLHIDDALETLFNFEGAGALRLDLGSDRIKVNSRTFNQGLSGTYGQFIPLLDTGDAIGFGGEARLIQLSGSTDPDTGFRTNLGFVNITDGPTTVRARLYDAVTRDLLRSLKRNLAASEYFQFNDIFAGLGEVKDAFAVVSTTSENGAFLCYASVVDNKTGDPVFILPAVATDDGLIAAAAQADGDNETVWRSDLEVHEPTGDHDLQCDVTLYKRDQSNTDPDDAEITIPAGRALRVEEVLGELFDFEGAAALQLTCDAEAMATSKTYNQGPNGTFGQFIPLIPMADAISFGENYLLLQLRGSDDPNSGFRTNIGLVNTNNQDDTVIIDLQRADGQDIARITKTVRAFEYLQLNRVFQQVDAGTITGAFARISSDYIGEGGLFCYASVVDNITGDPTYVMPEYIAWTKANP